MPCMTIVSTFPYTYINWSHGCGSFLLFPYNIVMAVDLHLFSNIQRTASQFWWLPVLEETEWMEHSRQVRILWARQLLLKRQHSGEIENEWSWRKITSLRPYQSGAGVYSTMMILHHTNCCFFIQLPKVLLNKQAKHITNQSHRISCRKVIFIYLVISVSQSNQIESVSAFLYFNCSWSNGVKCSATRSVSTAISIVAIPSATTPLAQKFATRSFTVT